VVSTASQQPAEPVLPAEEPVSHDDNDEVHEGASQGLRELDQF
jgi:hypothetical protein